MKKNIRTSSALCLTAAAAALVLSGCSDSGTSGSNATAAPTLTQQFPSAPAATAEETPSTTAPASATGSAEAAPAEILIKGFKYEGTEIVSPGTEITVTNEDVEAHSITADAAGAFDVITKVGTTTFTAPTEPGTYPYHCIFHANMKGTLTVE